MLHRILIPADSGLSRHRAAVSLAVSQAPCGVLLVAPHSQAVTPLRASCDAVLPNDAEHRSGITVTAPAGFVFLPKRAVWQTVILADAPAMDEVDYQTTAGRALRHAEELGTALLFQIGGDRLRRILGGG